MSSTLSVRVARRSVEADGIVGFELVAADGRELPAFAAGSHVDVHVPEGPTRQYSLCNDSSETHRYLIAVLREPASRGGSAGMHDRVQPGDLLTISVPKNHFALVHGASSHLLLAGGIGVTPLLCMVERLAHIGADFEMHYGTRSRARTAFLARIEAAPYAARVRLHFDDEAKTQRLDLAAVLAGSKLGRHLYVCGPRGFMDAVLECARGMGWPESHIHFEFFGADPAAATSGGAFTVKLASSGRTVAVAADRSVVQALAEAGVTIATSCEQGVCGTCLTRVLEGEPEHRDHYLTPEEQAANDQFLPCCSRSKSPLLVLDL